MSKRLIILLLLVSYLAVDVDAQNRRYRRRGAIFGGLAGAAIGAAIGDKGDNETAGALIGGAVGAIAGGSIGDQKDRRIEHNQRYHSGYSSAPYSAPYQPYPYHPNQFQSTQIQPYDGGYYHRGLHPSYRPERYGPPANYRTPTPAYRPPVPQPASPSYNQNRNPIAPLSTGAVAVEDVLHMRRNGLSDSVIIQQIQANGMDRPISVHEVIQLYKQGLSEDVIVAMQINAPQPASEPPLNSVDQSGPSILAPNN